MGKKIINNEVKELSIRCLLVSQGLSEDKTSASLSTSWFKVSIRKFLCFDIFSFSFKCNFSFTSLKSFTFLIYAILFPVSGMSFFKSITVKLKNSSPSIP